MYKIIGGDQREYGPVTADQIRAWIAEGRANGETRILPEGTADWTSVGACPEFVEALTARGSGLGVPPVVSVSNGTVDAFEVYASRGATLDLSACFLRSWHLLIEHFWLLVGASALMFVINLAFYFVPVLGTVAHAIIGLVLWGGLDWLFLRLIRGHSADMSDIFAGFQIGFLQLVLGGIVTSVLILIGLLLCVLPGLYLMVAWLGFSPLLIMDKQMEFWPALELSRRIVTRHLLIMLALFLVCLVLLVAGVLVLGLGFFIALPLATGAIVYAYEDIFGPPSSSLPAA